MDFPISVPSIGLVDGKFADEDPLSGSPGSLIPAQWGNAVTLEILNVIEAAGLEPDEDNNAQLLQAISAMLATATPEATETVLGLVKRATQLQVDAGTNDTAVVTPKKLATAVQNQTITAFATAGTATALTLAPTPAIQAYAPYQRFSVKFSVTGGINPTLNVSTKGPKSLKQYDFTGAKVAAAFVADQISDVVYDGTDFVVLDPLPARAKTSIVGLVRNGRMSITAASTTATYEADEIVVETALGGTAYQLASFSQPFNLAITGAGGMDTGAAPANGYVAVYAIYNPSTGAKELLGVNATSITAPEVYGGANMPAGYTASALLTVLGIDGSLRFRPFAVRDRTVYTPLVSVFSSSSNTPATTVSIAAAVPRNAVEVFGEMTAGSSTSASITLTINSGPASLGQQNITTVIGATSTVSCNFSGVPLTTVQSIGLTASANSGAPSFVVYIGGYKI